MRPTRNSMGRKAKPAFSSFLWLVNRSLFLVHSAMILLITSIISIRGFLICLAVYKAIRAIVAPGGGWGGAAERSALRALYRQVPSIPWGPAAPLLLYGVNPVIVPIQKQINYIHISILFICLFISWGRVSLYNPSWLELNMQKRLVLNYGDLIASASPVLELETCATIPGHISILTVL